MALRRILAVLAAAAMASVPGLAAADDTAPIRALAQREAAMGKAGASAMAAMLDGRRDRDTIVDAMEWLQDAAKRGRHEAQFQLGVQYETAPNPDYTRAIHWYLRAADQGNAMALNNLSSMFLLGKGVRPDPERAAALSLAAAEKGNVISQARIGAMYLAGEGVARDPLKAEYWLERAATAGHLEAQAQLGTMMLRGDLDWAPNIPKGLIWLKKAAGRGHAQARAEIENAAREGVAGAAEALK